MQIYEPDKCNHTTFELAEHDRCYSSHVQPHLFPDLQPERAQYIPRRLITPLTRLMGVNDSTRIFLGKGVLPSMQAKIESEDNVFPYKICQRIWALESSAVL
jgi:hypothetical protein